MKNPWKKLSKINPQREEGNRQISNNVYQKLMKANLTGADYKVILCIIHFTWGFKKVSDTISVNQMIYTTKLSDRMIRKTIKKLKERRIIHYQPSKLRLNCGSVLNEYLFNKHYDTWGEGGCTTVQGLNQEVVKPELDGKLRLNCGSDTKEIITKEIITKENNIRLLYFFLLVKKSNKFDEFWRIYPPRNGKKLLKGDAEEFFLEKIKDEDIELVLQAARNYATSRAVTDEIGIRDAIRFLRKEYWQEWIEPEKPKKEKGQKKNSSREEEFVKLREKYGEKTGPEYENVIDISESEFNEI